MIRVHRLRAVALVIMVLALAFPALAQQERIAIGPYVQNVGKDCATICWSTLDGQLAYEPASRDQKTSSRIYDHHKLTLRYLTPGTTYHYDILGDGSDAGRGSFTTSPEGEQPFRFVTIADCHNQTGEPIVRLAMADKPDMVFLPGDLVYDGRQIFHWEDFFRVNSELMRTVPYYPALGNHEHADALSPYLDFFSLPGNHRYYSFNRGSAHFVVLDSAGLYLPGDNQAMSAPFQKRFDDERAEYWQRQLAWLKEDLAGNPDAKYIFVFFHHPPYTSWSRTLESAKQVRARFGTVFQDHRVSAVFNGHDHHYNHALAGGLHFIMTDAGGEPLGADAPQPETIKCWKPHNYARVDVGLDRAHVRATDIDGNVIEEFDIMPRAAATTVTPQGAQAP